MCSFERLSSRPLMFAVIFAVTATSAARAKDEATVPGLDVIVKSREIAKSSVIDVKSKYKPTDSQYLNARKLYIEARGAFQAWTSQLRVAVIAGKVKDLRADDRFKKLGEDAQAAAKVFTDYVEQSGSTLTRGSVPSGAATGIPDAGLRIWNGMKDLHSKERQKLADFIWREARWESWEEIE